MEVPLCAEVSPPTGFTGVSPCSIQSSLPFFREERSNNAQTGPSTLTGRRTRRRTEVSFTILFSDMSPGVRLRHTVPQSGHADDQHCAGGMLGIPRVCREGYVQGGIPLPVHTRAYTQGGTLSPSIPGRCLSGISLIPGSVFQAYPSYPRGAHRVYPTYPRVHIGYISPTHGVCNRHVSHTHGVCNGHVSHTHGCNTGVSLTYPRV